MKKTIALLLALVLMLGCAAVLAEDAAGNEKQEMGTVDLNGSFTIKGLIPEGYTYVVEELSPGVFINAKLVKENDPAAPYLTIQVYLADNYDPGTRLNDVDEETLREIEESFIEQAEVEIDYTETAHGTKLMKVTEVGNDPDWIAFYSIYEGYEIELTIHAAEGSENGELSEETVEKAIRFLSDMDFVKAEEAVD